MDRPPFVGFSLSQAGQLYARRFEERSCNLSLDFAQSQAYLAVYASAQTVLLRCE
jgi:hypothetical protein